MLVWPCVQNVPGKVSEASPAGCTHGKAAQRSSRIRWSDYNSDLSRSRLGVAPAKVSDIAVDREVFPVFSGLLPPRPSPEENWACK